MHGAYLLAFALWGGVSWSRVISVYLYSVSIMVQYYL